MRLSFLSLNAYSFLAFATLINSKSFLIFENVYLVENRKLALSNLAEFIFEFFIFNIWEQPFEQINMVVYL